MNLEIVRIKQESELKELELNHETLCDYKSLSDYKSQSLKINVALCSHECERFQSFMN